MNAGLLVSCPRAHHTHTKTKRRPADAPRPARSLADTPAPAPLPHPAHSRAGQGYSGQTAPARPPPAEDTARAPRSSSQTPHSPVGPAMTRLALRSGLPARTQDSSSVSRPPPTASSRLQVAASSRKASPKLHPSPGRWRPFHPGQQLPTSCPSPQVSPKPSPTSCLKAAADSVMSLLSSPEPSRPGHSQARTRRLGQTEPGGLGSDLGTGLQLAPSSAGATLISDTRPPTGTPLKDTILGWAGDQSLSTEIHVGVTLPSHHAPKGSHAPHTPGPPLEPTSLCSPVSWTPVATPGSSSAGTSPTDRSLPQAAPRLVL